MSKIINETINVPKTTAEQNINDIRAAFEHRAVWFYNLLDEVRKNGADWESIGRKAIYNCGCFHSVEKKLVDMKDDRDLKAFKEAFINPRVLTVFEGEVIENTGDRLELHFYYCPLVTAWKKLGASQADIEILCDIAMEGDRAIADKMEYQFNLGNVIAKNKPFCELRFQL